MVSSFVDGRSSKLFAGTENLDRVRDSYLTLTKINYTGLPHSAMDSWLATGQNTVLIKEELNIRNQETQAFSRLFS